MARNSPSPASSTSLRRTCAFSLSSAKYAEREPMASSTLSTRRRTSSCVPTAIGFEVRDGRQQARQQRVQPRAARRVEPLAVRRRRGTRAAAAPPCSASREAARRQRRGELRRRRAAQPRLDDAVDAGHFGRGRVVPREDDFLERAGDARAMQLELARRRSPSRGSPWSRRCARGSARRRECV